MAEPIRLGPEGSQPVVFQKTLFRIPAGTPFSVTRMRGRIVGEDNWGTSAQESGAFNVTATDELEGLGYDVRDASDAVFTPNATLEARYQMAAIIHGLDLEYEVKTPASVSTTKFEQISSRATMDVEFQIFDSLDRKMVAKTRVIGRGEAAGRKGQPMPPAFLAAFRTALADPAFVAPLRKNAPHAANASFEDVLLSIRRCPERDLSLPRDLPRAQDAVVVVVVGSASGTGTIVSDDGYMLTAAHVVGDERKATLRFKSGLELPAEVVRVDPGRDAALLKAPGRGHACLRTDETTVRVGTEIWAIGNPIAEELARSVTRGVASGNRTIRGLAYLQTDAAVNPGNSGGPLLDAEGELRGIVVHKVSNEAIEGLGFAVPVGDAENALGLRWTEPVPPRPESTPATRTRNRPN
ncbi:MAG: trypsin-like peptidase domain-containing protein [Deltaproteobacteria bacterium]|nr:trypsin-like peptidase domain-containing protein [Deltaproteobacteria bacterium]